MMKALSTDTTTSANNNNDQNINDGNNEARSPAMTKMLATAITTTTENNINQNDNNGTGVAINFTSVSRCVINRVLPCALLQKFITILIRLI